ncbi:MAG: hypothetical protein IJ766_07590 [Clostridia bacterium]|nr:hypothetical protein [Clostridia bacterium]
MRQVFNLNQGWLFSTHVPENIIDALTDAQQINLPCTWPARGKDAYKGKCVYRKELPIPAELHAIRLFLEFKGVANSCLVYINDKCVGIHKGGFTAFRFEITGSVTFGKTNVISVVADNADYSAMCSVLEGSDFFGGIWGDVNLIIAGVTHFALDDGGSDSIYINTKIADGMGKVAVIARISNPVNYDIVSFTVYDAAGACIGAAAAAPKDPRAVIDVENPALWRPGTGKAYLYKLRAKLLRDGEILDEREVSFGFRKLSVSAENGLELNGRRIRLRGVSMGQDSVVPKQDFAKDIALLHEIGANAVRPVNYYQTDRFFELCDKNGIMVWCELPLDMSAANEESAENLIAQYVELAKQYYNRPSVCFVAADGGGTAEGAVVEKRIYEALRAFDVNRICVGADFIRGNGTQTAQPAVDAAGIKLSGAPEGEDWAALLDSFHIASPETPILISEYGTAGDERYHSAEPVYGDFTEEYQALYHEKMWERIARREFISGCFVAELYDAEEFRGGLLTAGGKAKKDAFMFYKSQWAMEKFVKIAGSRFENRADKKMTVKVYSNCGTVILSVNGKPVKAPASVAVSGVFVFDDVKLIRGKNVISVVTEEGCADEITVNRKKNADASYICPHGVSTQA